MRYNEPHNTPWWPGGDFAVVAPSVSPHPLSLSITHRDRSTAQIRAACDVRKTDYNAVDMANEY